MKTKLTKSIAAVLALSMIFGSITVFASTKEKEPNITVERISRDEYLAAYAEQNDITIEEANIIDIENTEESIEKEQQKFSRQKNSEQKSLSLRATDYVIYKLDWDEGYDDFKSEFAARIHAKVQVYWVSGYGQYQIVTNITNKTVSLNGTGSTDLERDIITAEIEDGRDEYSNNIRFLFSGTLIHEISSTVSSSLSADIEFAGFNLTTSTSGTTYCRKVVDYDEDINSNSVLV